MRIRVILFAVLLMLASVLSLALPKIEVYRYAVKDFKTVTLDGLKDPLTGFNPWVLDDSVWPKDKKILLLVHGFPMFGAGKMRLTMNGLAVYFSKERKIGGMILPAYDCIYAVEYPKGYSVYETDVAFSKIFSDRTKNFSPDQKIDIFAHSLGGLVVRSGLEIFDRESLAQRVRKVVFMGTPQTGFSTDQIEYFKSCFDVLPVELTDLNPEGLLMFALNNRNPPVDCDYYSVVGLKSSYPKRFLEGENIILSGFSKIVKNIQDKNFSVHDGLIDSKSAGFDIKNYCKSFKLITLDLNHEYINNHQLVFDAIDKWMIDDKWFVDNQTRIQPQPQAQPQVVQPKIEILANSLKFPQGINMSGCVGIGCRAYPYNPISNPQTNFKVGEDVDVVIIFTFPQLTENISYSADMEINGPDNQGLFHGPVGINFDGWWQTGWFSQGCQFYKRGEYKVLIKNDDAKIIAKKTFTVN